MNNPKGNKLQDSKLWKDSIGALQKMWDNYLEVLATYFQRMSRLEQEQLITKYSWIVCLGATAWIWCVIEPVLHSFPIFPIIFLIGLPASLAFAYWFGKNIVSRIMLERLSKHLK